MSIVKIKLKNSLGKNKGVNIENPADFFMVGQQNAIAIISATDIKPFLVSVPDGIEAHIPFDELSFIFTPDDIEVDDIIEISYKKEKQRMQRKIINSVT